MKRIVSAGGLVLALITLVGCGKSGGAKNGLKEIASTANDTLIEDLGTRKNMKLTEVIENRKKYGISDKEIESLQKNINASDLPKLVLSYLDPNNKRGIVPTQWVYLPNVSDNDPTLKKLESIDAAGRITVIDGSTKPEDVGFPIITLGYSEEMAIPGALKMQLSNQKVLRVAPGSDGGLMLDRIRFENDFEPWIKGAAEVYMVVSYIGKDGKGASEIIEAPSVDYSKRDYDLRLIVHTWNKNHYQMTNIAFFEHDAGTDYAELTKHFLTASVGVATAVIDPTQITTIAVVAIVNQLASAIIEALPKSLLRDDDDLIDSINTIEKYKTEERRGVSANVKANFSHYDIKINDE